MYGMIRWNDGQKKSVILEQLTVLRVPFLCAHIRSGGGEYLLRRRVRTGLRRLHKQGITSVVLPAGFPFIAEMEKEGISAVSTLPLRQEIAAGWIRRELAKEGKSIAASPIAVVAERLSAEVVRTVTELSVRHRYLYLSVSRGGEELSRRLRREYGVSLQLYPAGKIPENAAAVAAFTQIETACPITLRLYDQTQPLPPLTLPPNQAAELPEGMEQGQLIAALRRAGAVKRVEVVG